MRLYLDESVSVALASVLTQHDVDCQTARDAGLLGKPDSMQLEHAASTGRALFTHDTRDFLRLASEWQAAGQNHAGIILAHQVPFRDLVARFRAFLLRYRDAKLANRVIWLPPPQSPTD